MFKENWADKSWGNFQGMQVAIETSPGASDVLELSLFQRKVTEHGQLFWWWSCGCEVFSFGPFFKRIINLFNEPFEILDLD